MSARLRSPTAKLAGRVTSHARRLRGPGRHCGRGRSGRPRRELLSGASRHGPSRRRGRIGECWRTQGWDAFLMNSVNAQTVMPGQRYDGPDPEGFMSQHGWVALLEAFVEVNRLPVETGAEVTGLACAESVAGAYRLEAPRGTVLAGNVVIASGARNRARVPTPLAGSLPRRLLQLHAADYRNAAVLHISNGDNDVGYRGATRQSDGPDHLRCRQAGARVGKYALDARTAEIIECREHVRAHHVQVVLDRAGLVLLAHAARKGPVDIRRNAALAPQPRIRTAEADDRGRLEPAEIHYV